MTQPRTLVVTNDLPPRPGGIQTYVHQMLLRQPAGSVVVLASQWRGDLAWDAQQPYEIHRHPGQVLLPTPRVLTHAVQLAADCTSAWFGAMAPLGLLAPALRQRTRITRAVASTHGHEVGWARAPGTRQLLRRTAGGLDAVTVLGSWTGEQLAGVLRGTVVHRLPGGVDTTAYAPDPAGRAEVRRSLGIGGDQPVVVCVSRLMPRKGQDVLIEALPKIREQVPGTVLLLVGGGPSRPRLQRLAGEGVIMTGSVPADTLAAHYAAGDVFAMPCRSRLAGIDVEGLGLVYLEASAVGLPVVAGRSGGAPEAVREGVTGHTVLGTSRAELVGRIVELLRDPVRAARMGAAGRAWVTREWEWDVLAPRLTALLNQP